MATVNDDFADTGALSANWTGIFGTNIDRDGGFLAAIADGAGGAWWDANEFLADQYAQIKVTTKPTSGYSAAGPVLKLNTTSEYCYRTRVLPDVSTIVVQKADGATNPVIITATGYTLANGDIIKLTAEADGANLDITLYGGASGTTQLGTYNDTTPLTGTRIGLYSYYSDQTWRADDFEAGDITPPSPPAAPTNVTAGALTTTGATCSWTDASGDETGFKVEISAAPHSSWSAVSGSPTAANVTSLAATSLSNGTTYKFRVASTNANGDSSWVESAAFLTQTPVKIRPASDITVGSWAPSTGGTLFEVLDESSANDGDYVSITGTGTFEVKLGTAVDPAVSYGHTIRYRLQGDGAKTFTVRLVQGTTIRSTDPTVRVPSAGSWTPYSWTLTAGEADAITDYSDLRIRVTVA